MVDFQERAKKRRLAMNAVMWDDRATQWKDVILDDLLPDCSGQSGVSSWRLSGQIVASNFLPLWLGLDEVRGPEIVKSLEGSGLVLKGGISWRRRRVRRAGGLRMDERSGSCSTGEVRVLEPLWFQLKGKLPHFPGQRGRGGWYFIIIYFTQNSTNKTRN
jgi:hypothetical protein